MSDNLDYFTGLIFGCPFQNECDTCPLKNIREIEDIEERVDLFLKLSNTEYRKIIDTHLNCTSRKLIMPRNNEDKNK